MQRVAWTIAGLATGVISVLVGAALLRIADLDARELDRVGATVRLHAGTQVLLESDVLDGDDLTYELCTSDAMDATRWTDAMTLSLDAADGTHLLDQVVDARVLSSARRGAQGACFDFFEVGPLTASGHFVVSARDVAALEGVDVRGRVMAERRLTARDRNAVLGILLGAVLLVVGLALRAPSSFERVERMPWPAARAAALGVTLATLGVVLTFVQPGVGLLARGVVGSALAIGSCAAALGYRHGWGGASAIAAVVGLVEASTLLSFVTPPGPEMGLVAGLALGVLEVGIAVLLARSMGASARFASLGLQRPTRAVVAAAGFVAAPLVGVVLRLVATRALSLVPSTGEAPIEAYVSWPSGLLSFAVLSVVAPIGEEIFFRGLVFGALRGEGGTRREAIAFAGAWSLFVLAHLPQTWGSWGGLVAIAIAGLGFTALRALTGSVLISALAHLVYNGLLAAAALASV